MRPDPFAYIGANYLAKASVARYHERRQDHEAAKWAWADAAGWRRLAEMNGVEIPEAKGKLKEGARTLPAPCQHAVGMSRNYFGSRSAACLSQSVASHPQSNLRCPGSPQSWQTNVDRVS